MVRVSRIASDQATAWRIRDALAIHPLLGGATAQINIIANYEAVILEGWTIDEELIGLAIRLALPAAGHRTVQPQLRVQRYSRRPERASAL
jgi:hypothetical protein